MVAAAAVWLAASPSPAQEEGREEIEDGMSLLSKGARTILEGLLGWVDPQMRDMAEALRAWDLEGFGPDDLDRYQMPEMLPNGDIIIRRKPPAEPDMPLDDEIDI